MADTDDTEPILPLIAKAKHFSSAEVESFASRPVKPLLVYGTRIVPIALARVIDGVEGPNIECFARKDSDDPAVLHGFPGSSVSGLVVFALTAAQVGRIGEFERDIYTRETHKVKVQLTSEEFRIIEANLFVWVGDRGQLHDPDEKAWSFEEFLEANYFRQCLATGRTNRKLNT